MKIFVSICSLTFLIIILTLLMKDEEDRYEVCIKDSVVISYMNKHSGSSLEYRGGVLDSTCVVIHKNGSEQLYSYKEVKKRR